MKRILFFLAVWLSQGIIQQVTYATTPVTAFSNLYGNVSLLWFNASNQDARLDALELIPPGAYDDAWVVNNVSDLWVNASNQDTRLDAIEALPPGTFDDSYLNGSVDALNGNVTDLWSNASAQEAHITNLWGNASTQENAYVRKTGDTMTGALTSTSFVSLNFNSTAGNGITLFSGASRINLVSADGQHALLTFRPAENTSNEIFIYGLNNTLSTAIGDGGIVLVADNFEDNHFSPYTSGVGWLGSYQRFWNVTYTNLVNTTRVFLNNNQGNMTYSDGKCAPCRNSTELWFG